MMMINGKKNYAHYCDSDWDYIGGYASLLVKIAITIHHDDGDR
jgi:hypothetical protein